ncbi:Signal recognition particle subunit SRP72 [Psilocybe cubensis]|uniref:Signal recognition particle subunit SRP72 n=2 Tax=Psilocybe cubensis TaxID=181762 RepID=A0A8H8CQJ6_PSICU|nr:Signal recognition particle subunit SRP72 [Psilocybe cubensis]KAH9485763.1 Signal recognition particle subunit SRP72 [Psilocybe cubensis]
MPPKPSKSSPPTHKPTWKDNKGKPKQQPSTAERLRRFFTSLCAQIDGGHFSNAVKTCDKILRLDPTDADARQTKLFLLLQTEQYNAALNLIATDNTHAYEKAYSLYRLQRESEARNILESIKGERGENDRGIVHLEAQLARNSFLEGSYQEAFDLYNDLLDTAEADSEEHSDILTNLQASQRHLDFINTGFLHALDALPNSITSTLESAPPPSQQQSTAAVIASASALAGSSNERQSAIPVVKKVRKSRIPAGVIPGVTPPPDPERWLKKSERSTFGQGRRRRGAGGGGGATQGSATVESTIQAGGHSKSGGGKGKKKK